MLYISGYFYELLSQCSMPCRITSSYYYVTIFNVSSLMYGKAKYTYGQGFFHARDGVLLLYVWSRLYQFRGSMLPQVCALTYGRQGFIRKYGARYVFSTSFGSHYPFT